MERKGKRILIRPINLNDLDSFIAYRSDPLVSKYQGSTKVNRERVAVFIRTQKEFHPVDEQWSQLAIQLIDGEHIGDLGIRFFDKIRQCEVGISIAAKYHRQGIGTEALSLLFDLLFNDLGIHRIIAISDIDNISSQRLLTKLGMQLEGRWKSSFFDGDNWRDEYQ